MCDANGQKETRNIGVMARTRTTFVHVPKIGGFESSESGERLHTQCAQSSVHHAVNTSSSPLPYTNLLAALQTLTECCLSQPALGTYPSRALPPRAW